MELWDTAGQEKFSGLREGYYIQAKLFLVVYDQSNITSHNNLIHWLKDIRRVCPNAPIFCVRNKCDLQDKCPDRANNEISVSCRTKTGISEVRDRIISIMTQK